MSTWRQSQLRSHHSTPRCPTTLVIRAELSARSRPGWEIVNSLSLSSASRPLAHSDSFASSSSSSRPTCSSQNRSASSRSACETAVPSSSVRNGSRAMTRRRECRACRSSERVIVGKPGALADVAQVWKRGLSETRKLVRLGKVEEREAARASMDVVKEAKRFTESDICRTRVSRREWGAGAALEGSCGRARDSMRLRARYSSSRLLKRSA